MDQIRRNTSTGKRSKRAKRIVELIHATAQRVNRLPHEVRAMPVRDFIEMNQIAIEQHQRAMFERFRMKGAKRGK